VATDQQGSVFVWTSAHQPSGDPKPSRDDIDMTHEIQVAAKALGMGDA